MNKLLTIVLLIGATVANIAHAAPLLNGISIHSELGADQFIAALYTKELSTDAKSILIANEEKQIQVRVLADNLFSRQFKRMWIEGMAINASSTELEKQSKNMAAFSNMLKINLIKGDIFAIQREADGVKVSLNGAPLGEIDDPSFFDLLLRTWIGPVPLSSRFRENLLKAGDISDDLRSTFNATVPSDDRIAAVAANVASRNAPEKATASNERSRSSSNSSTRVTAEKPQVANIGPKIEAPSIGAPNIPAPPGSTVTEAVVPQKSESSEHNATPKPTPKPQKTQAQVAKADNTAKRPSNPANEVVESSDDEVFTAESLLAQQLYIARLKKWTYQYLEYPATSLSRGEQGEVRLNVTIDRKGIPTDVEVVEASEYARLTRAATKAVKKANPFPAMPDAVKGDTFTFTLPILFVISEK